MILTLFSIAANMRAVFPVNGSTAEETTFLSTSCFDIIISKFLIEQENTFSALK